MLSILDLSIKILNCFKEPAMTLMKLQKLCYYNQAWYYTFFGVPLVNEEFVAEEFGNASPDLRGLCNKYRTDGSGALAVTWEDNGDGHPTDARITVSLKTPMDDVVADTEADSCIVAVSSFYGKYDGSRLSALNHREEPWILAQTRIMQTDETEEEKQLASVIKLDDMRDCHQKQQPIYDILSMDIDLKASFAYKQFSLLADNKLILVDADLDAPYMESIITNVDKLNSEGKFVEKSTYSVKFDGKEYRYFGLDHNIILVTPQIRNYIMAENIKNEIKELLEEGKIKFNWEYISDLQEPFYAYSLYGLGILASESTRKETIKSAVEMLIYKNQRYSEKCSVQDMPEKKLVDKVYLLYKNDKNEFFNLLGLNENIQIQGEKTDAK